MDIILLERIGNLGSIGDVVTVKDGYARNFLLPQKKALRANEGNRKVFEARRAQLEAENLELFKKPWPHLGPIMVMIGDHPCACGGAGQAQQLASDPCILAGDDIGAGQHFGSARRKIAEIADWCGDEGECAGCHDGATAGKWVLVQDIAH